LRWKYKRNSGVKSMAEKQYALVQRWLFVFTAFISVITLNFTYAMTNMWMYDDKSIFLQKASIALLFASVIYVLMNMTVMFFPHILYGLPFEIKREEDIVDETVEIEDDIKKIAEADQVLAVESDKKLANEVDVILADESDKVIVERAPQLFSNEYIEKINLVLQKIVQQGFYLKNDFLLNSISDAEGLPLHHLTYYFNNILKTSFSDWRNDLRIQHAKKLMEQNGESAITLAGIAISCGYNSPSTFIRAFKHYTGKTPSEYKRKGLLVHYHD